MTGCATGKPAPSVEEAIEALDSGGGVRSMEDIRAYGAVRVGMVPDTLPLCFLNKTGNYTGFERDLVGYPIGVQGLGTEVVPMDIADAYDFLANGRIDIACGGFSPLDERAEEAAYSFPYMELRLGVLSAKAAPFTSVDELANHVLLACEGSYAASWATEHVPAAELHTYETYSNLYQALQAGRGDAIIADEIVLQGWIKKNKSYTVGIRKLGDPRPVCLAAAAQNANLIDGLRHELRNYIVHEHWKDAYKDYVVKNVGTAYSGMLLDPPDDA